MSDSEERQAAVEIVRQLKSRGFQAYWAGGCVRDMLLGRTPHDYDIVTDADPDEVIGIFPSADLVGAHFGVVIVTIGDFRVEIARFRRDIGYSDGRHPDRVAFSSARDDAHRRDFTVNGMFYDPVVDRVLDYVNGQEDLQNGVIRTIGDPVERFGEDYLRMLRAIRFGCRLQWKIDVATKNAIRKLSHYVLQVSAERIRDEVVHILTEGGAPLGVRWLADLDLMKHVMPEVAALSGVPQPVEFHPEGDVLTHTILMLSLMREPSPELAMGVLLHDVGKPRTLQFADRIRFHNHPQVGSNLAADICGRLRFSGMEAEHIVRLVADHHRFMHVQEMRDSKLKRFIRSNRFEDHLELHRLDCVSSHGTLDNYQFCRDILEGLEPEEIRPDPLITGYDLIELGHSPGPRFKSVLTAVEDAQLEGIVADRDQAIALAEAYFSDSK